ncbi:hypothetical protein AURDEDRAFT_117193 [Auricularia subglabra TFB-10046 SS5]|uniref:Uncharacterized protein n=1 Tax=Auricularia subglabra (strain TFB-10046 / SS5) TaxID=717982 RepID=J0CY27_AURST|nr:hypothetical protein AURDEDRAFT_117193 [Auricularia subglabra TFB-10046 SS5]
MVLTHSAVMDAGQGFVLAADGVFLRDNDIPPPDGDPVGSESWQTRPEPRAPAPSFIWQTLPGLTTDTAPFVRLNERARFLNTASASLPSARAVNYVYVARMLHLYLDKDASAVKRLSRPIPPSPRPPPPEDEYDAENDVARRPSRQQRRDDSAWQGRCSRRSARSHGPATPGPGDMESFELLFRLTHGGRYLDYYDEQRKVVEVEKARAVDRWRLSLPKVDPGEV